MLITVFFKSNIFQQIKDFLYFQSISTINKGPNIQQMPAIEGFQKMSNEYWKPFLTQTVIINKRNIINKKMKTNTWHHLISGGLWFPRNPKDSKQWFAENTQIPRRSKFRGKLSIPVQTYVWFRRFYLSF